MCLQILSKDSVAVSVDAVVYYRIFDPKISVTNVKDASRATRLMAQTSLRNVLGAHTLAEMLSERESISSQMQVWYKVLCAYNNTFLYVAKLGCSYGPLGCKGGES